MTTTPAGTSHGTPVGAARGTPHGTPRGTQGWLRAHLGQLDIALALFLAAGNVAGMSVTEYGGYTYRSPGLLALVLNLLVALPVAGRRRWPMAMAVVGVGAYLVIGLANYSSFAGSVSILVLLYSVGAYAGRRPGLALVVATSAGSIVSLLFSSREIPGQNAGLTVVTYVATVLIEAGAWMAGRMQGARRLYMVELEDRAERVERAAQAELRAALAEERARVARELHDVVAHHVSVMTVQAAAARRTLERSPERSSQAMLAVEETGRSALTEMRRIVGGLRETAAPADEHAFQHEPQRGVGDVPSLIERARDAGLQASLRVVGDPREVPTGVGLAVYRVVQEGLTNTLKHAGPAQAEVLLRYDPDAVVVQVTDDGGSRTAGNGAGGGSSTEPATEERPRLGLVGMRERVMINGGTVRAGARAVGGFEVVATLPLGTGAP